MAELPDPTNTLDAADKAAFDEMAAVRAHAEGRAYLGQVYVRMFNNAGVAMRVGALGEHLRFHGVLPDQVRELVILRFAVRQQFGYVWSHHQRAAKLAGISQQAIDELTAGDLPGDLSDLSRAVLEAVDAVVAKRSIPADVQARVVKAHGNAGAVEIVGLCGLYTIMGDMVRAFDIPLEPGLPKAPF